MVEMTDRAWLASLGCLENTRELKTIHIWMGVGFTRVGGGVLLFQALNLVLEAKFYVAGCRVSYVMVPHDGKLLAHRTQCMQCVVQRTICDGSTTGCNSSNYVVCQKDLEDWDRV
jgi:hypothetical protein